MDWFLNHRDHRLERVKSNNIYLYQNLVISNINGQPELNTVENFFASDYFVLCYLIFFSTSTTNCSCTTASVELIIEGLHSIIYMKDNHHC